jgi:hypothetical protein
VYEDKLQVHVQVDEMQTQIEEDATSVLRTIAEYGVEGKEPARGHHMLRAAQLKELTGLSPERLNDAVELLAINGYVELIRTIGGAPFTFAFVTATPMGRFEYQRLKSPSKGTTPGTATATQTVTRHPTPIGSPYGFTDADWEFVEISRRRAGELKVVLGLQHKSETYSAEILIENIKRSFGTAVEEYNSKRGHIPVSLDFRTLKAGYGEHLFNEIARDIISSDIAVFETSDQNPNVMIEMGVALTWGTRVLPIRHQKAAKPPSDISGQTWAEYQEDGAQFIAPDHTERLVGMIERAMRKKLAG